MELLTGGLGCDSDVESGRVELRDPEGLDYGPHLLPRPPEYKPRSTGYAAVSETKDVTFGLEISFEIMVQTHTPPPPPLKTKKPLAATVNHGFRHPSASLTGP